jgi:hypothetical protein
VQGQQAGQQETEDRLHIGTLGVDLKSHCRNPDGLREPIDAHVEPQALCDSERVSCDSGMLSLGPDSRPTDYHVGAIVEEGDHSTDQSVRHVAEGIEVSSHNVVEHHLYVVIMLLLCEKVIQQAAHVVAHSSREVETIGVRVLNVREVSELLPKRTTTTKAWW